MIFGSGFNINSYVKNEIGEVRSREEQINSLKTDL